MVPFVMGLLPHFSCPSTFFPSFPEFQYYFWAFCDLSNFRAKFLAETTTIWCQQQEGCSQFCIVCECHEVPAYSGPTVRGLFLEHFWHLPAFCKSRYWQNSLMKSLSSFSQIIVIIKKHVQYKQRLCA